MEYTSNKKAWVTTKIFKDWLLNLDLKMKKQKRQILVFLDKCSAQDDVPCFQKCGLVYCGTMQTTVKSVEAYEHIQWQ